MKPKQGFIFHILLFFMRTAGKELAKVFLISKCPARAALPVESNSRYKHHNTNWKSVKQKLLWNRSSSSGKEMGGHTKRAGSQRAMGKGRALEEDLLEDAMGSRALWPPLVEKNLLLTTTKEREKWGEHPSGLHPQGFPEGLTQTGLQASPFPPSLVETFILVSWTCPPKVHTISEYTPIYSLLLQCHLTVRGCFPLTPAKCGIEVRGWGDGSLPEWVGKQPNGRPVCLTLLWRHNLHTELQANTVALWVSLFATMIPLLVPLRGYHG